MDYNKAALEMHETHKGKVGIVSKVEVATRDDLSTAYTPGVAEPCRKIKENPEDVYKYTFKGNMVAVVSNGTAVLGLGDIGPEAGLPVMEGKAMLFKYLGGVDCVPICLDTKDPDKIIETVRLLAPSFGGINLEDISNPKCFDILDELRKDCKIPVWHDDQQGTATVEVAGAINAMKLVGKKLEDAQITVVGAGAASIAIARSFARRKALMKSGTRIGTIAFARWRRLPLSKSAPRACCAFMILSVSSMRIGMKRSAIDIIIEISCTGTPTFFRAPSPFSRPSVSWFGVVVSVMSEEPSTRRIRRAPIMSAMWRPSRVIFRIQNCTSTSPGVRKRLKLTEIRSRITMLFRPRVIKRNGTLLILMRIARATAATPYMIQLFTMKREIRKSTVPSSFTRGSRRWITESTG